MKKLLTLLILGGLASLGCNRAVHEKNDRKTSGGTEQRATVRYVTDLDTTERQTIMIDRGTPKNLGPTGKGTPRGTPRATHVVPGMPI